MVVLAVQLMMTSWHTIRTSNLSLSGRNNLKVFSNKYFEVLTITASRPPLRIRELALGSFA